MSRDQKKSSTAKDLRRVELQVERVSGLIRNVLRKFPENTLTPSLEPFTNPRHWSFRLSSTDKNEVVLTGAGPGFSGQSSARFPARLLDAMDSEVTQWARLQYWSAAQESQRRLKEAAAAKAKQAKDALEVAQRNFDQATKAAEAAYAPTKKQRRAREKQFAAAE